LASAAAIAALVGASAASSGAASTASVRLTAGAGTGGSIVSNPKGISCSLGCSARFKSGTRVVLIAQPAARHGFEGWTGACQGSAPVCTLVLTGDASVNARFTTLPLQADLLLFKPILAVDVSPGGSVESSSGGIVCGGSQAAMPALAGSCYASFVAGTRVTLRALAAPGYLFTGWGAFPSIGRACAASSTCVVAVSYPMFVNARFARQ
jgi:hypothetical protein